MIKLTIKKSKIREYINALKKPGNYLRMSKTSSVSYDTGSKRYYELHYRPGAGLVPKAKRISEKRVITHIKRIIIKTRKSKKYIPKKHRR